MFEIENWHPFGAAGAYNSRLKWPVAGWRLYDGGIITEGSWGYVWSSTVDGHSVYYTAKSLIYSDVVESISSTNRVHGLSVRCVRR